MNESGEETGAVHKQSGGPSGQQQKPRARIRTELFRAICAVRLHGKINRDTDGDGMEVEKR